MKENHKYDDLEQRASQIEEGIRTYPEFTEREPKEELPEEFTPAQVESLKRGYEAIMAGKFKDRETINGVEIQVTWAPDGLTSEDGEYEIHFPWLKSIMKYWPISSDAEIAKQIFEYACSLAREES